MVHALSNWEDTIVAIATPPGVGALGIVRLSGNKAFSIINHLFPSKDLLIQKSHTIHVGFLKFEETILDEAVISLYKGPKSYTGEDVVEISCHGSPYIIEQVVNACISRSARLAKPGEFTQRAFLNGKMDLAQAESVADLIASNSAASQQTALQHMRGNFSHDLKKLREALIRFSALIELELDFSQEDVEFADRTQLIGLLSSITQSVEVLLQSFQLGNAIKNGVQVAIVGKPNAGKSTLLNTLLQEERAIVSDIAGTTRDTIEEVLNIQGILFRLIDTAGIRQHTDDTIEKIGIEKSRNKIDQADIVLLIQDAVTMLEHKKTTSDLLYNELQQLQKPLLHIANKADLLSENDTKKLHTLYPDTIIISAKTLHSGEKVKSSLFNIAIHDDIRTENTVVTNIRHYHALQKVSRSLKEIMEGIQNNISGDLLALDIRQCLHYLGEITGEITNEDQLDFIFSKFCIGK